ncbi:hypothetical protein [Modestobacter excelsi]|nr:hypothetical protein [Modestobacter excelsi]
MTRALSDRCDSVYEATVRQHHVLIRGGDPRFDDVTDARLAVGPP